MRDSKHLLFWKVIIVYLQSFATFSRQMNSSLHRQLGLLALTSTGICSMIGASIYVVPFMVQRHVPGIGPYVWAAFLFAAVPASLAAFAYAILASAMPRAGGSYVFASRGLHPYLGFVASFSQWFGLCIAIGVISYVIVPFLREVALALTWTNVANELGKPSIRLILSIALLWLFVLINIRGIKAYEKTLIPLMILMFCLGLMVIGIGFTFQHQDFIQALSSHSSKAIEFSEGKFSWPVFLSASAVLFSSFIGFDSIAQAGGEARNPGKLLPRAMVLTMVTVSVFYFLFCSAVYHTVPWQFVASEALVQDVSAPGLLSYVVPASFTVWIVAGAAIALTNDLPAMLLSVSRLLFAWAEDGIFPRSVASIHPIYHTPQRALMISGVVATVGILGCHLAGDFFLGVDVLVIAMLFNFLLMCLTVLRLPYVNPVLANEVKVVRNRKWQWVIALSGIGMLLLFLFIHVQRDVSTAQPHWYFHSTYVWLVVMVIGSLIFWKEFRKLRTKVNVSELFKQLPPE
jgi:basic amino acid/polyamine antiporter, APA family